MKNIVITGSTRGIGYGLAEEFLRSGHRVIISGRAQASVDAAINDLQEKFSKDRVAGIACDMREYEQVVRLWDFAREQFGSIEIWINNAGISQPQTPFWELQKGMIQDLVDTNVTGAMYGAQVALKGFREQGGGAFYNMEGLGSDGRRVEGLTLYGTSKRALQYLTNSLVAEVEGTGIIVGAISPGMVLTDLIIKRYEGKEPEEWESARRIFNILADKVETVTPFLAEQILANQKNGTRIRWLGPGKILWRFMTARFSRRDLFQDMDI